MSKPTRLRPPRRLGWIALSASAAIHAALLLGLRFHAPRLHTDEPARPGAGVQSPAMRVVAIRPVERDVATAPPVVSPRAPARVEPPAAPDVDVDASSSGTVPGTVLPDPPGNVSERIAPAAGDRRLWERAPRALNPTLEPLGNLRERVGLSIAEYNDSVAAAAEAARRAADWTTTRAYGERWGFSPDTIHLGNTRRVLRKCSAGPCPGYLFQPGPGRREEQAARLRIFNETQTQAKRAELERAFQERVRAMRTHRDSVRATRRGGG